MNTRDQAIAIEVEAREASDDMEMGIESQLGVEGMENSKDGNLGFVLLFRPIRERTGTQGRERTQQMAIVAKDLPQIRVHRENDPSIRNLREL